MTCHIFEAPLGTGSYNTIGNLSDMVKMIQEGKVLAALNIHQDFLKSWNLLHKWGFVDSQSVTNVAWITETTTDSHLI